MAIYSDGTVQCDNCGDTVANISPLRRELDAAYARVAELEAKLAVSEEKLAKALGGTKP